MASAAPALQLRGDKGTGSQRPGGLPMVPQHLQQEAPLTCQLLEGDDGPAPTRQWLHVPNAAAAAAPVLEVEFKQVPARQRPRHPHHHRRAPRHPQQFQPLLPRPPLRRCQLCGTGRAGTTLSANPAAVPLPPRCWAPRRTPKCCPGTPSPSVPCPPSTPTPGSAVAPALSSLTPSPQPPCPHSAVPQPPGSSIPSPLTSLAAPSHHPCPP